MNQLKLFWILKKLLKKIIPIGSRLELFSLFIKYYIKNNITQKVYVFLDIINLLHQWIIFMRCNILIKIFAFYNQTMKFLSSNERLHLIFLSTIYSRLNFHIFLFIPVFNSQMIILQFCCSHIIICLYKNFVTEGFVELSCSNNWVV